MLRILPVLALIVLVLAIFASIFIFPRSKASISGTIDLNGTPPTGSTISILQSIHGLNQFTTVVANLPVSDNSPWVWTGAQNGKNYDLKLQLLDSTGKELKTSNLQTVTAPSTTVSLRINYSSPLPPLSATQTAPAADVPAFISGTLDLNGYVPAGTIVTFEQQPITGGDYQAFGAPLIAQDNLSWVWTSAILNQEYNIRAVLTSRGVEIGKSLPISVSAPAADEVLTINSTAIPPVVTKTDSGTGTISGTINLNGVVPSGASIVILASTPGANKYQTVLSGISPTNGTSWSWTSAQAGTAYQLVAVLKTANLNDISVSSAIDVTAPAANESLTLNSNASLPQPANLPSITCNVKNSATNSWSATINYSTIPGAQTYWLQLGSTSGGSDLINVTQTSVNGVYVTANATLNDSVNYYAQYAYSMSPGVAMGSNFSAFSASSTIHCP